LIGKSGFSLDATASVNLFNCWKIKILMNLMRFSYEYMWFIILFLLVGKLFLTSFEFAIVFDLNVVHFIENQYEDRDFDLNMPAQKKKEIENMISTIIICNLS
jgi:hypothetical protein